MEHDLKTIEDILNVVNAENIDNFLIDFRGFLSVNVLVQTTQELVGKENVEITREEREVMHWIDDEKTEAYITIKVKE